MSWIFVKGTVDSNCFITSSWDAELDCIARGAITLGLVNSDLDETMPVSAKETFGSAATAGIVITFRCCSTVKCCPVRPDGTCGPGLFHRRTHFPLRDCIAIHLVPGKGELLSVRRIDGTDQRKFSRECTMASQYEPVLGRVWSLLCTRDSYGGHNLGCNQRSPDFLQPQTTVVTHQVVPQNVKISVISTLDLFWDKIRNAKIQVVIVQGNEG